MNSIRSGPIRRPPKPITWWHALAGVLVGSLLATLLAWVLPRTDAEELLLPVHATYAARPSHAEGLPAGLTLHGIIPPAGGSPGIALLKEPGRPVVLVPEGHEYAPDLRVVRVLEDRIVMHQSGTHDDLILTLVDPSSRNAGH